MFLLVLLLLVGAVHAASLQYNTATLEVTGFRPGTREIPEVEGRTVVTGLPDTFLSAITLPAGCTFDLSTWGHLLSVTNPDPGSFAVGLTATPTCFNGEPVTSRQELKREVFEALNALFDRTQIPARLYAYTLRACPATNTTQGCQDLRQIVYHNDPDPEVVKALATEALSLWNTLP